MRKVGTMFERRNLVTAILRGTGNPLPRRRSRHHSTISRLPMRRVTALVALCGFLAFFGPGRLLALQRPSLEKSDLLIEHSPLPCVTTTAAPQVDAAVRPGPALSVSRVYFRASNHPDEPLAYVVMHGQPETLTSLLPRPLPGMVTAVDYFVEAVDKQSLQARTPGYSSPVTADNVCLARGVAVGSAGAGLTIGLTKQGQNPVPAGFNKNDIVKVILVTGAVVTLAAALAASTAGGAAAGTGAAAAGGSAATGAAAAGGISTGVLIGGGIVVAGGIAVAAGGGHGGGGGGSFSVTASVSPQSGSTATSFTFSASPSHGSGAISYNWSFDDGASASGSAASHTFQSAGTHRGTVTATDSSGHSASASATVTVTGPSPLSYAEASASWSGPGNVTVQILNGGGTPVGNNLNQACGANQGNRTSSVILQGSSLASGNYTVTLAAQNCTGQSPVDSILVSFNALSSNGTSTTALCPTSFDPLPTSGSPQNVCSFSLP